MIQKRYNTKESIIKALEHLIDIYDKSVYNAVTNPSSGADIKNIVQKLSETKKVKEEVIKLDLKDLDKNHTYNIVTREKDEKLYHTITLEKIEESKHTVEKEYILSVENK